MFAKFSPVDLEKGRAGDVKIVNGMIRHLRNGKWGELERRYTSRRDRNAKPAAGGGKQAVELDDIDRHVERILTSGGKAATQGLDVESDCSDGPRQVVEIAEDNVGDKTEGLIEDDDDGVGKSVIDVYQEPKGPADRKMGESVKSRKRGRRGDSALEEIHAAKLDLIRAQTQYALHKSDYYRLMCGRMRAEGVKVVESEND
ncbi:hypothetical protein FOZ63_022330 [Perkinsus olseni]|uniref:Uncharacterized protein n=1 Tax=Perkinsus olseni TaxID=32597 RepID=A0A7J6TEE7_PEROL|nr:hypothetical protein FOZ63_022330 [Perkinsus olseni]